MTGPRTSPRRDALSCRGALGQAQGAGCGSLHRVGLVARVGCGSVPRVGPVAGAAASGLSLSEALS